MFGESVKSVERLCNAKNIPSNSQGDPCRDSFWFDPEWDPGHDDDQAGWNVGVEEVVTQATLELKDDLQTSEFTWNSMHFQFILGSHKALVFLASL